MGARKRTTPEFANDQVVFDDGGIIEIDPIGPAQRILNDAIVRGAPLEIMAKYANDASVERAEEVVPTITRAVIDILTIGAIAPHRSAIKRHLSDRAISRAIAKLESIRKGQGDDDK